MDTEALVAKWGISLEEERKITVNFIGIESGQAKISKQAFTKQQLSAAVYNMPPADRMWPA